MVQRVLQHPKESRLSQFHGMFTAATEMKEFFALLRRVARSDYTVMIHGETGAGKELAARAIHAESPRGDGPFRTVNCATLSPTLLESEMFGHKKGAFTGAVRDHPGLFLAASKGTLFLDEVADIPLDLQGRLLRVLQERTFLPVGGTQPVHADVRIISATNRRLDHEVHEGRFREDLSYRIRVVPLYLPPLRHRSGDIEALLWHFIAAANREGLRQVEGVTQRAMNLILRYSWPGNVRQLMSTVQHAFAVEEGSAIDLPGLPPEVRGAAQLVSGERTRDRSSEKERILQALRASGGHKSAAAKALGMSRQTLWRKMTMFGI